MSSSELHKRIAALFMGILAFHLIDGFGADLMGGPLALRDHCEYAFCREALHTEINLKAESFQVVDPYQQFHVGI